MTEVVVVPVDQSDIAERALPVARSLARQLDARLHLVSVLDVSPDIADRLDEQLVDAPLAESVRAGREEAEAYLASIANGLDAPDVTTEVLIGVDPAVEIDETVSEMDDALLVITSHGRSGIRRMFLGSKTTRLVQLARYPLVIVPSQCNVVSLPDSIDRVLLALDGSSFAEHAKQTALDVFAGEELSFQLLRVVDPLAAVDTDIVDRAGDYLESVAGDLRAAGYAAEWTIENAYASDIANRIAVIAHVEQCDLITMATHGRTGFSRWYYGSVADSVLRTATKPVLLIHPSDDVIAQAPESRSRRAKREQAG